MSSASTILHSPPQKRPTSLRRGAFKIAVIYLAFATLWISFAHFFVIRLVDETKVPYLETLEYIAFTLCTGILLYVLVMRFARERAVIENALRRNERRYR